MIDFACKQFSIDEIIKCGLGLSKADFVIMNFLIQHNELNFTTTEVSIKLGLNLTTVQRSVKKLYEREVVVRTQQNLDNGGYVYFYRIKDKSQLRSLIKDIIDGWVVKFHNELKKW